MVSELLGIILAGVLAADSSSPAPEGIGHYAVLTCKVDAAPPFESVDITCGPGEAVGGADYVWWQLDVRKGSDAKSEALVQVRALSSRHPLAGGSEPIRFQRYLTRIPAAHETFDYRNVHTGRALLPGWGGFAEHFIPHPARGSGQQSGLSETAQYLGHVLSLRSVATGAHWEAWDDVKVLDLDPELLVGTARGFKDKEGHRLPQTPKVQEYTYVPFSEDDFRVMFDAGFNIFWVEPGEPERIVRTHPAFYIRGIGDAKTLLQYPADLYRSNYLGANMFMDEPTILLIGDRNLQGKLWYFSDAANAIEKRVRAIYNSTDDYGRYMLERPNAGQRFNTGDMRLDQYDFPSWETLYETTFYQMAGGCNGIAHEGRYQLPAFDKAVARFTHQERQHTPDQLLRYYYAFLRGGTRPFGKFWGTAIYGQCDPAIAPKAVTLAYDLGARYIWYWTSDHDHHLPWVEQLELTRTLRQHAAEHPRPSIFDSKPTLDKAIVIPYGYIASLDDLSWIRVLSDEKTKAEAAKKYQRFMESLMTAVHECYDRNEDFDITIEDGREITGYRKAVRITNAP